MEETNKGSLFLQLSWKIAAFCVIVFGIGCIFTDPWVWGKGVLFGCIFTIIRLRLMDLSIQKAVKKDPDKASGYATRQYILRYVMSIAVLVVAALEPSISLYGTMLAMFSLKAATYIQGLLEKPAPKDGSVQFEEWVDEEEEDEEWDRWETYNLKARNKKRKFQERNKIYNEQAVDAMPVDDGVQLSLFDEDTEEKEVKKS